MSEQTTAKCGICNGTLSVPCPECFPRPPAGEATRNPADATEANGPGLLKSEAKCPHEACSRREIDRLRAALSVERAAREAADARFKALDNEHWKVIRDLAAAEASAEALREALRRLLEASDAIPHGPQWYTPGDARMERWNAARAAARALAGEQTTGER